MNSVREKKLLTSESVTEGHPDKICDQISDAVLDAIIKNDPMARVACETSVTTGMVLVMGEISTSCYVDIPSIVRKLLTLFDQSDLHAIFIACQRCILVFLLCFSGSCFRKFL